MKKYLYFFLLLVAAGTPSYAFAQGEALWIQASSSGQTDTTGSLHIQRYHPIASTSAVVALDDDDVHWVTVAVEAQDSSGDSYFNGQSPLLALSCDYMGGIENIFAQATLSDEQEIDVLEGVSYVTIELNAFSSFDVEDCDPTGSYYLGTFTWGDEGTILTASNNLNPYLGWYRNGSPLPSPPEFDPSTFPEGSGVVEIFEPVAYEATSSPVNVSFSAYVNEQA